MKNIRSAKLKDVRAIQFLLDQLGYPHSETFLEKKLMQMLSDDDYQVLVYESEGKVVGLMTIHFYKQIIYETEIANIGVFVVDEGQRNKGVGRLMEEYCVEEAKARRCILIEVFSVDHRIDCPSFLRTPRICCSRKVLCKGVVGIIKWPYLPHRY